MPSPRSDSPPLIGITCCAPEIEEAGAVMRTHKVGDKYIEAIAESAGAMPVLIPALGPAGGGDALLDRLDGLFLTGSPSNV